MPCTDGGVPYRTEDLSRVHLNARVACSALSLLTEEQVKSLPLESQIWWNSHQEADRIREQRAKEAAERERIKQAGLAKLTPAERKALNL